MNRNIRPSFIAYARIINLRAVRIESLLCLVLAPLYLLPEVLLFGGGRLVHLSIAWRLRSCLLALLTLLLLPRLRRLGITGLGVATLAIGLLHSANLGLGLAPVCEIETPLFAGLYLLAFISIPIVVPLHVRILTVPLLPAVACAAYFLSRPAHLQSRWAPMAVGLLGFSTFIAVAIGHAITRLVGERHRRAVDLRALNRDLGRIVAERTAQARALLARADAVQEAERARIAREVHDELGQVLTTLRLEIGLLESGPPGERPGPARTRRLHELLDQALQGVRRAVSALRPPVLDDLGICAAVESLLLAHERSTGAECEWSIDVADEDVPGEHATTVFRVLQEALTNIARHAQAAHVYIHLRREAGSLVLLVRDDGVGLSGREGAGLPGMRERASLLSGELEVRPAAQGGTQVRLRLPLPTEEAPR